jgi:hypothetical protein
MVGMWCFMAHGLRPFAIRQAQNPRGNQWLHVILFIFSISSDGHATLAALAGSALDGIGMTQ